MIGTELVWKKIKKSGESIIVTTLTQSLGTFILVSLVFGIVFYFSEIPIYLALIFGGIALATAPAPALSVVREFKTDGPVTKTLIPMAALDDMVGVAVFFTTIAIVAGKISEQKLPAYMIPIVLFLPLVIGLATGFLAGLFCLFILKMYAMKDFSIKSKLSIKNICMFIVIMTALIGGGHRLINYQEATIMSVFYCGHRVIICGKIIK